MPAIPSKKQRLGLAVGPWKADAVHCSGNVGVAPADRTVAAQAAAETAAPNDEEAAACTPPASPSRQGIAAASQKLPSDPLEPATPAQAPQRPQLRCSGSSAHLPPPPPLAFCGAPAAAAAEAASSRRCGRDGNAASGSAPPGGCVAEDADGPAGSTHASGGNCRSSSGGCGLPGGSPSGCSGRCGASAADGTPSSSSLAGAVWRSIQAAASKLTAQPAPSQAPPQAAQLLPEIQAQQSSFEGHREAHTPPSLAAASASAASTTAAAAEESAGMEVPAAPPAASATGGGGPPPVEQPQATVAAAADAPAPKGPIADAPGPEAQPPLVEQPQPQATAAAAAAAKAPAPENHPPPEAHLPPGWLSLERLRDCSADEARAYLMSIDGLGRKSVACILLLALRLRDFPVDTNVGRICSRLGCAAARMLTAMRLGASIYRNSRAWNRFCCSPMPVQILVQLGWQL